VKDFGDGSLMELVKKFENLSGEITQRKDALGKINGN
jgi:hypothetical protein